MGQFLELEIDHLEVGSAILKISRSIVRGQRSRASSGQTGAMSLPAFTSPSLVSSPQRRPRHHTRQPLRLSTRRAPRTFVRLSSGPDDTTLLQTSITTFSSPGRSPAGAPRTLDLHAVLHIADSAYYAELQHELSTISKPRDGAVLYELILPSSLSYPTLVHGLREVRNPVRAPLDDSRRALRMRAVAQADALDLCIPRWYLADLPAEKVKAITKKHSLQQPTPSPLRFVASFLPCPELFAGAVAVPGSGAGLLARSLAKGDVASARRIAFARKAVASTAARAYTSADSVTAARDSAAVSAVKAAWWSGAKHVALVYGAWHAGQLCRRSEDELGMDYVRTRWQTAMVLPSKEDRPAALVIGTIVAAVYFCYAGLDWVFTIESTIRTAENGIDFDTVVNVAEIIGWYTVRHFVPYVGFQRWFDIGDGE